jgi:hypothetical protein
MFRVEGYRDVSRRAASKQLAVESLRGDNGERLATPQGVRGSMRAFETGEAYAGKAPERSEGAQLNPHDGRLKRAD